MENNINDFNFSGYDVKLEKELKKYKFKQIWFDDKSGYWFSKIFKSKIGNIELTIETDRKLLAYSINDTKVYIDVDLKYNKKNIIYWNNYLTKLSKLK